MDRRVLLVDDEVGILNGLKRTLRKEPYEVITAQSGKEALEILAKEKVSLVVSDQCMPGMSGIELLTQVREKYRDTVRILLTGKSDVNTALDAINKSEVYRFLVKPLNDMELVYIIREIFEHLDIIEYSSRLVEVSKKQSDYISKLENENPGISVVKKDSDGAIILDDVEDMDKTLDFVDDKLQKARQRIGIK